MATIEAFGFEKARQRGSHLFYRHPETGAIIAFPYRRPHISAVYVKEAIEILRTHEQGD